MTDCSDGCRECGNDEGPYGGLCLDCLEADESLADPPDDVGDDAEVAVNESMSMNAGLAEGLSDGKYKKIVADRGGQVDGATWDARRDLADLYYGMHEARDKHMPDGSVSMTPDFVSTPASTNVIYP